MFASIAFRPAATTLTRAPNVFLRKCTQRQGIYRGVRSVSGTGITHSLDLKKNNVDDILFIKKILKDSPEPLDLEPTGLANTLLPSQYALLARLGFKDDLALPDQLAWTALQHPSRYPDNTFFESLLFYGKLTNH